MQHNHTPRANWRPITALGLLCGLVLACSVAFGIVRNAVDPAAREAAQAAYYRQEAINTRLEWLDVATAAAWRLAPFVLLGFGLALAWRRWGERRYVDAHHIERITRAQVQRFPTGLHSLSFHDSSRPIAQPMLQAPVEDETQAPSLPGFTDFANILQSGFTPSKNSIFLALGQGNEQISVPVNALCHVAFIGATGGGKSNLLRMTVPQLQAIGAKVVLADPHYAPFDPENGDDWRAIAKHLYKPPAVKPAEIDGLLDWLIEELAHRLERRNAGDRVGAPLFLAFDELPVIVDQVKDVPDRLGKILREGRKVHLLTVGASQDFLVKTIGGSSAVRDCYRTGFYVGGDKTSAAAILDMPAREIDDGALTTGVALLRSSATSPARLVRIPLASNQAIEWLLADKQPTIEISAPEAGISEISGFTESAESAPNGHGEKTAYRTSDAIKTAYGFFDPEKFYGVKYLRLKGESKTSIIRQLWQVTGGKPYQVASAEYDQILAALADH